MSDFEVDVIVT